MTRKLKPIDVPVEGKVAQGILDLPVVTPEGSITTVGATIEQAAQLMSLANTALTKNPLCEVAATALMKEQKRRGNPSFRVDSKCRVFLHIDYHDGGNNIEEPEPLPSLEALRSEAAERGIDISDLGRQKRAIVKRLGESPR